MRLSNTLLLLASLLTMPLASAAAMQQKSGLAGIVSDTLGNVLEDVQVGLVGTPYYSLTDEKGEFKLLGVVPGNYTLSMRRLGYSPFTMKFIIVEGSAMNVDFELTQSTVRLAPLNIKSERISPRLRRVGFENRLRTAGVAPSHFITRQELEKRNIQSLQQVIDRMGSRARTCSFPNVFLDGVSYNTLMETAAMKPRPRSSSGALVGPSSMSNSNAASETGFQKNKPLETFLVRSIEGMEVYTSTAEAPAEFRVGPNGQMNDKCTVVLWTRDR